MLQKIFFRLFKSARSAIERVFGTMKTSYCAVGCSHFCNRRFLAPLVSNVRASFFNRRRIIFKMLREIFETWNILSWSVCTNEIHIAEIWGLRNLDKITWIMLVCLHEYLWFLQIMCISFIGHLFSKSFMHYINIYKTHCLTTALPLSFETDHGNHWWIWVGPKS